MSHLDEETDMEVQEGKTAIICGIESQGWRSCAETACENACMHALQIYKGIPLSLWMRTDLYMHESKFPKAQGKPSGKRKIKNAQSLYHVPTRLDKSRNTQGIRQNHQKGMTLVAILNYP